MSNYFLINSQTNICENSIVVEDGANWNVPSGYFLLPIETTPNKEYRLNEDMTAYELFETVGGGGVGDLWDGERLIDQSDVSKLPIPTPQE